MLLALLLEEPKHGYRLKQEAGLMLSPRGPLGNNVIYPLLRRFLGRAWVRRQAAPGERGQRRWLYTLTAAGRGELTRGLAQFPPAAAADAEAFLLRVGLMPLLPPPARRRLLGARREVLRQRLAGFAKLQHADLDPWGREVLGFLSAQARRESAWLARLGRLAATPASKSRPRSKSRSKSRSQS